MLAALERQLRLGLAVRAFEPQHHLLGRLGLFVEDGLRLPAVAGLLAVVAALALGDGGCLGGGEGVGVSLRLGAGKWGDGRVEGRGRGWGWKYLAGFVLCDFVLGVLLALFAFAVGAAGFGDLDGDASVSGARRRAG